MEKKSQFLKKSDKKLLENLSENMPHSCLLFSDSETLATNARDFIKSSLIENGVVPKGAILQYSDPDGGIDQIRQLKRQLSQKYAEKDSSIALIAIIDHIDAYSQEAQNAILKQIEEPNNGVIFILTCTDKNRVLSTILSRNTVITLHRPSGSELEEHFKNADRQKIDLAIKLSRGKFDKIVSYINDENENLDTAKRILSEDVFNRLVLADTISKDRVKAREIVEYIQAIVTHLAEANINSKGITNTKDINKIEACEKTIRSIDANVNTKLALDNLFVYI